MDMRLPWRAPLAVLLVALALLPGALWADDEPTFEEAWANLAERTAEELDALASECHKRKLFAWRNEAAERILIFQPDHKQARRWLKYRIKDGAWTRAAYKPPRNLKAPSGELGGARSAVSRRFAEGALTLLETHAGEVGDAQRQSFLRVIGKCAPGREEVHAALGEVRTPEGSWVLRESLDARAARERIRGLVKEALAEAPLPAEARPQREDNALRLGWNAIYEAPLARVLGTVEKPELLEALRRVTASDAVFAGVFGPAKKRPPQLSLYLLAGSSDKQAVLKNHPAANDAYRAWAKRLQSSWLPKTFHIWIHAPDPQLRLEWCSRQAMGHQLSRRFGIRGAPGWAFEGCGLYLSGLIANQRRTFFVKRTQYGESGTRKDDLWSRLREKDTDWRDEARTLLASKQAPDLRLLLGKKLNAMNTEDMLAAFALCAFLLEGRGKEAPKLLHAVGKGKQDSIEVLSKVGLDPVTLEIKLRRWLEETR